MEKFVPFEKLSKKKQKALNDQKRGDWGNVNPATQVLPDKKKYSREHVFLLIMIYYLKSMLSISDIQSLLEPLSEKYFPKNEENGLTLSDIYQKIIDDNTANEEYISEDIIKTWERTRNSFAEHSPSTEESEYLDDFSFIYQLGYDIYIRKQIIEKLIDKRRKENPPKKKGSKKK